jgi:hypothetical protein
MNLLDHNNDNNEQETREVTVSQSIDRRATRSTFSFRCVKRARGQNVTQSQSRAISAAKRTATQPPAAANQHLRFLFLIARSYTIKQGQSFDYYQYLFSLVYLRCAQKN